jgi:hypothetical protein
MGVDFNTCYHCGDTVYEGKTHTVYVCNITSDDFRCRDLGIVDDNSFDEHQVCKSCIYDCSTIVPVEDGYYMYVNGDEFVDLTTSRCEDVKDNLAYSQHYKCSNCVECDKRIKKVRDMGVCVKCEKSVHVKCGQLPVPLTKVRPCEVVVSLPMFVCSECNPDKKRKNADTPTSPVTNKKCKTTSDADPSAPGTSQ